MGEGHDTDVGSIDTVHDAKWKAPERKAPIPIIERFADVWQIAQKRDNPPRLPEEF